MSINQQILTIGIVTLTTMLTRFIPFLIFPESRPTPKTILKLGRILPPAILGMLVIYSIKDIDTNEVQDILLNTVTIGFIMLIHVRKRNMILSIFSGTFIYVIGKILLG